MALKKLLSKLEKGSQLQGEAMQEAYPSHFQYNNGGSTLGNSTSIFDGNNFNQRSFKFGKDNAYDRPRQGFSREPFMGKNQKIPDLDKGASRFLGFIDSFSDGFIRGGITTAISRSAKDVARLGKFFLSQRGIGFLFQQLALQATQPDILAGNAGGKIGEFISGATGLSLNNNRTFNIGLNILGQSAVNFTGVHLNRSGLSPIWQDSTTYAKLATEKSDLVGKIKNNEIGKGGDSKRGNRLLTLYDGRMTGIIPEIEEKEKSGFGQFLEKVGDKIKDLTGESGNSILYEYKKGPGSIYGLGKTTIYRYQNSEIPIQYSTDGVDSFKQSYPLQIDINGYQKIRVDSTNEVRAKKSTVEERLKDKFGEERSFDAYRENRVNTGTPGNLMIVAKGKELKTTNIFQNETIDKVNALDIYQSTLAEGNKEKRDLIKFYFDIVRPGNSHHRVVFRAFLDDYSDNFTGNWNKFNYAGRGEPFFTYNNFDRNINFSFKIAAQTRHEMRPLYRKLNYLASTTAPTYSNGRMRGTFVRANIGSLISNVPGFFSNINLSWNKNYPWEIAMDRPEDGQDTDMIVVPHILDVKCSFTPIHDFIPSTSIHKSFIGNNAAGWFNRGLEQATKDGSYKERTDKEGNIIPKHLLPNERTHGVLRSSQLTTIDKKEPWNDPIELENNEIIDTRETNS